MYYSSSPTHTHTHTIHRVPYKSGNEETAAFMPDTHKMFVTAISAGIIYTHMTLMGETEREATDY
jgi:hypothetical protein